MLESFLRKNFPQHTGYASLAEWRQHVLKVMLTALTALATVVALPSILLALSRSMWQVALTDSVGLALAYVLWLADGLNFRTRAWALCGLLSLVGVALLFITGPASQIYLIASPVMAAIFLGIRPALYWSFLNTLTLFSVGYLFNADVQVLGLEGQPLLKWTIIAVNFAFINTMIVISIGLLLRGLEGSMVTVRDSEERFRTAFLTSPDAISITRMSDKVLLEVNDGFLQLLGRKREDLIGKNSMEASIWHDLGARETLFDTVLRKGEVRNMETDFVASEGRLVTVLLSSHMITIAGEQCSLSVARDFTQRKAAERELADYRDHLEELVNERTSELQRANEDVVKQTQFIRTVADAMPSQISYWSATLHCGFANQAYEAWSGIEVDKLPGMSVQEVLGEELFLRNEARMRAALRGEPQQFQEHLVPVAGPDQYLSIQYIPHRVGDKVTGFYVLADDITELKTAELNLLDSNRKLGEQVRFAEVASQAKSRFLANMSHEIRTPMNGVVGMIDILQTTSLSREQHRMLGTVHDSALSLLNILNDILDFSKIEANKLELELLPTQLRELAEGVTQLMNTAALLKKLSLSYFVDPAVPHWIQTDPTRLRQVLLNLLGNSIKFTSQRGNDHGEVSLHVTCCKLSDGREGIELRVRDNGIGMSPQSMAKLFQPFVQAEASTARTFGGTGLGLSITQRLVELLGGKISVTSTLGQGSEFCVQLPLQTCEPGYGEASPENGRSTPVVVLTDASGQETARFADARKSVRATKSADGNANPLDGPHKGLILLAEDNETNRDVMRQQLAILGYAVEEAHDGVIALAMWRSGRYALLLTDCEMPNLDGFGLSQAIRNEEPPGQRIPIIAVTAHAMQGESQRCKDRGMDDYLTKPLRMHALADMLAKWLPATTPGTPHPAKTDVGVESSPWNPSVLTEMIGDNPTVQTRLLQRYLELTRLALADIQTAVAIADIGAVTAQAHKLKSACRSVGALPLGDLCDQIEVCGVAKDGQACLELAGTLAAAFTTVEAHILEYLSSH